MGVAPQPPMAGLEQPPMAGLEPMWSLERQHWANGFRLVAGIDEAGRGALAGPLAVAAVILPSDLKPRAYRDSKKLSSQKRQKLALEIKSEAIAWAIEFASAAEIDQYNVLQATHRAAARAIAQLSLSPDALVTDYLKLQTELPLLAPPRADSSSYSVAAASILAKTARDEYMIALHQKHPEYGFAQHKGYGSSQHLKALEQYGVTEQHRKTFAPVAWLLGGLFSPTREN